jgi:hypothetical protein
VFVDCKIQSDLLRTLIIAEEGLIIVHESTKAYPPAVELIEYSRRKSDNGVISAIFNRLHADLSTATVGGM